MSHAPENPPGEHGGQERDARLRIPDQLQRPTEDPRTPDPVTTGAGYRAGSSMKAYGVGMELVAYVAAATGIGLAIDHYLAGGGRTWTLVGLGVGLFGGFWNLFRSVGRLNREAAERWRSRSDGPDRKS